MFMNKTDSFVQNVRNFNEKKGYVVGMFGKYLPFFNVRDMRLCLVGFWKNFGYNVPSDSELWQYLTRTPDWRDLSWVSDYGLDPFMVKKSLFKSVLLNRYQLERYVSKRNGKLDDLTSYREYNPFTDDSPPVAVDMEAVRRAMNVQPML
jgi:hypothetical protein